MRSRGCSRWTLISLLSQFSPHWQRTHLVFCPVQSHRDCRVNSNMLASAEREPTGRKKRLDGGTDSISAWLPAWSCNLAFRSATCALQRTSVRWPRALLDELSNQRGCLSKHGCLHILLDFLRSHPCCTLQDPIIRNGAAAANTGSRRPQVWTNAAKPPLHVCQSRPTRGLFYMRH